jgi:hypothetical protein
MAIYHSLGTALVTKEELLEKRQEMEMLKAGNLQEITFSTGSASLKAATAPMHILAEDAAPTAFSPIGLGKPLTVRIGSVFPGNLPPKGGLFGKKRGVMISSAVKSWQSFEAQPRALNILKQRAEKNEAIPGPAATEEGTPLVFYSPALTDRSLILTLEMAFDNVDESFFAGMGQVFQSAGGLPIFASAQPYLLAAGVLFNLGGAIGNAIFDSRAEFQATEGLYFNVPGEEITPAGFALVTRSPLDEATLKSHFIRDTGEMVENTSGAPYRGDVPYVVVSLDGTEDTKLESFSATAASAGLMKQFYNVREGSSTSSEILVDALKYYNDFRYRKEAQELQARLAAETDEEKKKEIQAKLDAVLKNIQTPWFKPDGGDGKA